MRHDNDAAMVRACIRTIARICDSRRCFGNWDVFEYGEFVVFNGDKLAQAIEADDARIKREFDAHDLTQPQPLVGRRR